MSSIVWAIATFACCVIINQSYVAYLNSKQSDISTLSHEIELLKTEVGLMRDLHTKLEKQAQEVQRLISTSALGNAFKAR